MSNYNPGETLEKYGRIQAEAKYRRDQAEQKRQQAEQERVARAYQREQTLQAEAARRQQEAIIRQEQARQAAEEQQSGGFWQGLGDTIVDFFGNLAGGVGSLVEGVVDAGAGIIGGIGGIFGADTGWTEDFIKQDITGDLIYKPLADATQHSILGDTFEDVTRGVGQMLPTIATVALAPVTGGASLAATPYTVGAMIASSGGQGMQEALNDGADFGGAFGYGVTQSALEAGTEALTGGFGRMASLTGKTALKGVGKTILKEGLSEAAEEGIQAAVNPLAKAATYKGADALKEYSDPEFYKGIAHNALVGGLAGSLSAGATTGIRVGQAHGVNNFYAQEQARTINESKATGDQLQAKNKLTENKIAKLTDQQQKTAENLSERLQKMNPEVRKQIIEGNRLNNLFNEDGSLKAAPASGKTYNPDSYSYSLRGQEDALQYKPTNEALNEAQRAVISEVEKMSQGKVKTVIADAVTTADGKRADAAYHDGVLYIDRNANAQKVATIHEITHSLEGTKSYNKFADFVVNEIRNSPELTRRYGDYLKRLTDTAIAYEAQTKNMTVNEAQYVVQTELVSQYAGEMFGNEEFIRRLSKAQPNVAQRLWQWIKDKIKVLTAKGGDRETIAFLQKAEKLYRKALTDSVGGVKLSELSFEDGAETEDAKPARATPAEARFSVQTVDGKRIVVIDTDQDIFEGVPRTEYGKVARQYMKEHFRGESVDGVSFSKTSEREYTRSKDSQRKFTTGSNTYNAKMRAATELDNLVKTSKFLRHEATKHPHGYNVNGYNRYATQFILDGKTFSGEMLVALGEEGGIFYDIIKIKESTDSTYTALMRQGGVDASSKQSIAQSDASVNSVREKSGKSDKKRYSLAVTDSQGRELSKEQQEFFKDSKVVDEQGRLLIVYHGTRDGNFYIFQYDQQRQTGTDFGEAYYFTTNLKNAKGYAKDNHKDLRVKEYKTQREILKRKILQESDPVKRKELEKQFFNVKVDGKTLLEILYDVDYDTGGEVRKVYLNLLNPLIVDAKEKFYNEVYPEYFKQAREQGKDGIIVKNVNDSSRYGVGISDVYIAFKPEQIKLTTNKTPTTNPDIRYSLAETKGKKNSESETAVKRENKNLNQILDTARTARDIVNRKDYVSAAVLDDPAMREFVKAVAGFKHMSSISGNIRERVAALADAYNEKNLLLGDREAGVLTDFDPDVAEAIEFIKANKESKTKLSAEELEALKVVSQGIMHLYKNYDKVLRNGKLEETSALASDAVTRAKKVQKYRRRDGFVASFTAKLGDGIRSISDPTSVARNLDGYDPDGFLTASLNEIKAGEIKAGNAEIELMLPFEAFLKEHKGFAKHLAKDEIVVKNTARMVDGQPEVSELKLTVDEAMTLYLTSKREQANIFQSGVTLERGERTETYQITEKDIEAIYEQFNDADREYLQLAHDLFNEHARKLKVETDQQLFGYAKVEDTNDYIPIRRDPGTIAKALGDERGFVNEAANTRNFSFNKATKKGAKNKVYIGSLADLLTRHSKEVSMYYGLALPLKNFNKIYNKQIEYNGSMTSYRELLKNEIWKGGEQYFRNLFNDIQGMKGVQTAADRALRQMRSAYSTYQLGANPKTVLSQTASFAMAYAYLDADALAKGLVMKTDVEAMYKYCPMTFQRMHDRAVVKAQGLMDKVGKVGDVATKPIQWMDNSVVHKLWNASQVQIEKTKGFKIGTDENLTEAGKLLDQVVRETQSNSLISERSAMNRSKNFLASSLTMFMSDATKQVSRLADAVGEVRMLRAMLKDGEAVEGRYKAAKRQLRKTITGVLASNIHIALLTLLFRWLYDKEEKDKDGNKVGFGVSFAKEFAGNLFGMIPIVRDIYGYLADDFEVNNYALSMINDLAQATKGMTGLMSDAIAGKPLNTQDVMKPLRQMIYAVGQTTGIPVRNVYNLSYGLISKFSPETAYRTKTLFYANTGYAKDVKAALEQGNTKMAETIARNEMGLRGVSGAAAEELARLYIAGESVMPKQTVEKVTIDGEEVVLTNAQIKAFNASYRAYVPVIESLLGSTAYKALDDAGRAKAVRFLEEYYYAQAAETVLKVSKLTARQQAAAIIPAEKLAIYLAAISAIQGETDKDGKVVAGSRKNKVFAYINKLPITAAQKYVLMGLAGYKNEKGKTQVESLIRSKVRDRTAVEELLEASGY